MHSIAVEEEYCPSCGGWYSSSNFNLDTGWCHSCSGTNIQPRCRCGSVLKDTSRTMCPTCRQERWYELHADEVEFIIVVKAYSLESARQLVIRLTRPICRGCGKPIKGAAPTAMFCGNGECHSKRNRFNRLTRQGLTPTEALAIINSGTHTGSTPREERYGERQRSP